MTGPSSSAYDESGFAPEPGNPPEYECWCDGWPDDCPRHPKPAPSSPPAGDRPEPQCEHGIALSDLCRYADLRANEEPPADDRTPLDPGVLAEGRRLYARCDELVQAGALHQHNEAVADLDDWRVEHCRALLAAAEDAARLRAEVEQRFLQLVRVTNNCMAALQRAEAAEATLEKVWGELSLVEHDDDPHCGVCRAKGTIYAALADPAAGGDR